MHGALQFIKENKIAIHNFAMGSAVSQLSAYVGLNILKGVYRHYPGLVTRFSSIMDSNLSVPMLKGICTELSDVFRHNPRVADDVTPLVLGAVLICLATRASIIASAAAKDLYQAYRKS